MLYSYIAITYPAFQPKTMTRFLLLIGIGVSLITSSLNIQAQTAPPKQWDKTYGAGGSEHLFCMKVTSDNGSISCGYTDSGAGGDKSEIGRGYDDMWVLK